MNLEFAIRLYDYDEWANRRYAELLASLEARQLEARIESSFSSLLETYAHIVGAEWIWLCRWLGESPTELPDWLEPPRFEELREHLGVVETERRRFLSGVTAEDLERYMDYRRFNGEPGRDRLADLLLHVVNHSSYHRGQLATMLRQVGAEPVATDYVLFCRELE